MSDQNDSNDSILPDFNDFLETDELLKERNDNKIDFTFDEEKNDNDSTQKQTKKSISKSKKGLIIFIAIIAITVFSAIGSIFYNLLGSESNSDASFIENTEQSESLSKISDFNDLKSVVKSKLMPKNKGDGYIAIIHIEGTIERKNKTYNQEELISTIEHLKNDNSNKAIMLVINSPGGGVYESDETFLALEKYKTSGKKVHAYMETLAASGGYYISCAATNISANRNTLTGSIGVIAGQTFDATELLNKIGLKSTTITAGKNKNMGNFNEVFSDEQKQIMQSIADDAYEQFTNIVANSRKMPLEKVVSLADGRIYTARQALDNGLIDSISSFDDSIQNLKDELELKNISVKDIKFEEKSSVYDYLTGASTIFKFLSVFARTGSLPQAFSQAMPQVTYPAYYYSR